MVLLTRTNSFRSPLKGPDPSSPPLNWKDEMSSPISAEIRQFNIWLQLNLFEPCNTFAKNNFACWVWPWWKTRFTNLWHLMETCTLDLLPKKPLNILARAWPPKFISSSWYKVIVRIHFPRFLCLFYTWTISNFKSVEWGRYIQVIHTFHRASYSVDLTTICLRERMKLTLV